MLAAVAFLALCAAGHESTGRSTGPAEGVGVRRHAVAFVSDSLSHGKVGDKHLSLNEVIQIHNRTLSVDKLSKEELKWVSGLGDVAWADLDPKRTKTITMERDLDVILDTPHGLVVGSVAGAPVTILVGKTKGFRATSDYCDFRNLVVVGGSRAVTVLQKDTIYGSIFENVVFRGQTDTAVDITLSGDKGSSELLFQNVRFDKCNKSIRVHDQGVGRTGRMQFRDLEFDGCAEGLVWDLGVGGSYRMIVRGVRASKTTTAIHFRRSAKATRQLLLDAADIETAEVDHALLIDGAAGGKDDLLLRLLVLQGRKNALRLGALGASSTVQVEEARLVGPVRGYGGAGGRVTLDNCVLQNGVCQLGGTGASMLLRRSRLERVQLTTVGQSALQVSNCSLHVSSVTGSTTAPVRGQSCYADTATAAGANTSFVKPRSVAHLARLDLQPSRVAPGAAVQVGWAMSKGQLGVLAVGELQEDPFSLFEQRLYLHPGLFLRFPGFLQGNGSAKVTVPGLVQLRGINLVLHLVLVPSVTHNTTWHLSPPRVLHLR